MTRQDLLTWARDADNRQFSSVAVLDRLVYNNWDALIALAAAAAVTQRVTLTTAVLVAPYRGNAALLAKQLASIDQLSDGRLVVGVAAGTRADDYDLSPVKYSSRGRALDDILDTFQHAWASSTPNSDALSHVGPPPSSTQPPVLVGGTSAAAFTRAATRADGWIMGGGDAASFTSGRATLDTAWHAAGRNGTPRTAALAYFALGPNATDLAAAYLGDYYRFLGVQTAGAITASALTDASAVRTRVRQFADAGCDELLLMPCAHNSDQVEMLSNALAGT